MVPEEGPRRGLRQRWGLQQAPNSNAQAVGVVHKYAAKDFCCEEKSMQGCFDRAFRYEACK